MDPKKLQNNPGALKIGQLLKTNKMAKLIELVLVFLIALVFIWIFKSSSNDDLIYNQAIIWLANVIMLGMVWLGIKLRGDNLKDFGFGFKTFDLRMALKIVLQSFLVFVLAIVGFMLGSVIMANITGVPQTTNMASYDYLKDNIPMLALTLLGVYFVSSFGEEVIYRAFLINRFMELGLKGKAGRFLAVLLSAVFFGLAHYGWGAMGIVQTGFMGLALGWSYFIFKKRIWTLVLAHAYMDTILMIQLYLGQ